MEPFDPSEQNRKSSSIPTFVQWLAAPAIEASDTSTAQIRKTLLVALALMMSGGGILWGTLAVWAGAEWQSFIPFGYVLITAGNLALLRYHRQFQPTSITQLTASLLLPFAFQWSLGGGLASGAMMLWGILALAGACIVDIPRSA